MNFHFLHKTIINFILQPIGYWLHLVLGAQKEATRPSFALHRISMCGSGTFPIIFRILGERNDLPLLTPSDATVTGHECENSDQSSILNRPINPM
jgi:hypothetical protein